MNAARHVLLEAIAKRELELMELRDVLQRVDAGDFAVDGPAPKLLLGPAMPKRKPVKAAYHAPKVDQAPAPTPVKSANRKGAAIDPAQIPTLVLDVLRTARRPLKSGEVCASLPTIIRTADIVETLRTLAAHGTIRRIGATISLRYSLPEFAEVTDGK